MAFGSHWTTRTRCYSSDRDPRSHASTLHRLFFAAAPRGASQSSLSLLSLFLIASCTPSLTPSGVFCRALICNDALFRHHRRESMAVLLGPYHKPGRHDSTLSYNWNGAVYVRWWMALSDNQFSKRVGQLFGCIGTSTFLSNNRCNGATAKKQRARLQANCL